MAAMPLCYEAACATACIIAGVSGVSTSIENCEDEPSKSLESGLVSLLILVAHVLEDMVLIVTLEAVENVLRATDHTNTAKL